MVQHVIALPGCIHVDNMTHMLKTAAADVRSQLMREREARAQGSKGRGNAHFAALRQARSALSVVGPLRHGERQGLPALSAVRPPRNLRGRATRHSQVQSGRAAWRFT